MNIDELLPLVLVEAQRLKQSGSPVPDRILDPDWLKRHLREPEVLQLIGLALVNANRITEALPFWRDAAAGAPHLAALWNNLGELCRRIGLFEEALEHLDRAVALAPAMPDGHFNRGNVLKALGRLPEAVAAYRRAVELEPCHATAWFNLGNTLLEEGKTPPAQEAYLKAIDLRPNWIDALQNLGVCELALDAVDCALGRFEQAYQLDPNHPELEELLATACRRLGRINEARTWYSASSRRKPESWLHPLRAAVLIDPVADTTETIETSYQQIQNTLDRISAVASGLDRHSLHKSNSEPPMVLAYQRLELRSVLDRYADLFAPIFPDQAPRAKPGKPHLGIVVTRGHEGVFAACFAEIVRRLANRELDVTVVCQQATANVLDHLLMAQAFRYLRLPEALDDAANLIRQSGIHLLYYWELGTDSVNYFLPFFRAAPIQVAGWGWPVTSGNRAVDYFLSAQGLETEQSQRDYREKLVTLPSLPTFYRHPKRSDPCVGREAFGLSLSSRVYLCHQNIRKWHPEFDAILERILEADPQGQLALIGDKQPLVTQMLLDRLGRTAPEAAARVRVIPFLEKSRYLDLLSVADVALDTRPYGGGANTVYDAISVGTPIVTWPPAVHRGRWAAAALARIDMDELIVDSADSYCAAVLRLGRETGYRRQLRTELQNRGKELFEDAATVDEHREFFLATISRQLSIH